jgi:nitroreductase
MAFIDLIRSRRSVRAYKERLLDQEKKELLAEAILRSPSSRGFDSWEFIFVDDPGVLKQLAGAKPVGAEFLSGAALAIVIAGNSATTDVWIEDCSIAATFVQLAAHDIGLESCWAQIRLRPHSGTMSAETYVQSLLGIPEHFRVNMIIGIGYPDEHSIPLAKEKLDYGRIHYNSF